MKRPKGSTFIKGIKYDGYDNADKIYVYAFGPNSFVYQLRSNRKIKLIVKEQGISDPSNEHIIGVMQNEQWNKIYNQ